ncbi:hypothetical protein KKG41_04985 [Patescibacteria group bacterium]|nr:hypothetical protein [Patescibacteria group bacterium]MBU1890527.1 hypothetical protein [Patescibacteria group bacterium]
MKTLNAVIKNLNKVRFFYFIIGVAVIGSALLFINTDTTFSAGGECTVDGCDGGREIRSVTPRFGQSDSIVTLDLCGCNLNYTGGDHDHYYLIPEDCEYTNPAEEPPECAIEGIDWSVDSECGGSELEVYVQFDLADADIAAYDVVDRFYRRTGGAPFCPTFVWRKNVLASGFVVYNPDITGWGWFGATTGEIVAPATTADATPGWMSLHCKSEIFTGHPNGTCYDPVENPEGVDYGVGMIFDDATTLFDVAGTAWLGESKDEDQNPANASPMGWVDYSPSETAGVWGALPNFCSVKGPAIFNEGTGRLEGWARILTLREYGLSLSCDPDSFKRTWTDTDIVDDSTGSSLDLAESNDGVIHAAWASGTDEIYYSQFSGGAWSPRFNISSDIGTTVPDKVPKIAIDDNNRVHVVFISENGAMIQDAFCDYDPEGLDSCIQLGEWVTGKVIQNGVETYEDLSIAVDWAGFDQILYVFYLRSDNNRLYLEESVGNGDFSAVAPFIGGEVTSSGQAESPGIAIDYSHDIHLVYRQNEGSEKIHYVEVVDELIESTIDICDDDSCDNPDIAVDPVGNPHIVYVADFSGIDEIYYKKYSDVSGWSQDLILTGGGPNILPSIAIGNDHIIHLLYEDTIDDEIDHRESTNGVEWHSAELAAYTAGQNRRPVAIVASDNTVRALFNVQGGDVHYTYSSALFSIDATCNNQPGEEVIPGDPIWGADWGWICLRGSNVNPNTLGQMRSCYDCEGEYCKICEVDDEVTVDPWEPPMYACNRCQDCAKNVCQDDSTILCDDAGDCGGEACIPHQKCRRTGENSPASGGDEVCLDDSDCDYLNGTNKCVPVCQSCQTCNLWGVSIEGPLYEGGTFHGYAWSAGGTVPVDTINLPPGSYDSGNIEAESDIDEASTDPCIEPNCVCTTRAACEAWGWENVGAQASLNQRCADDAGGLGYSGWGGCRVNNPAFGNIEKFAKSFDAPSITNPLPQDGNYFLSFSGLYTNTANELLGITIKAADGTTRYQIQVADLNDAGSELKTCSSPQWYLETDDMIYFDTKPGAPPINIDYFRITSLPVSNVSCSTGTTFDEIYVDEAGLGWIDFSNAVLPKPWTQTQYGNVYSSGHIGSGAAPTPSLNSTYIIQTPTTINNDWIMQPAYNRTLTGDPILLPTYETRYRNVLGGIDYEGMIQPVELNQYTDRVVEIDCPVGQTSVNWSEIKDVVYNTIPPGVLSHSIIHIGTADDHCSLNIDEAVEFINGSDEFENGSGTFVIEGNLNVNNNITYDATGPAIEAMRQLASVIFIVKGDVIVDPSVTNMVGTYATLGCDPGVPAGTGNCEAIPDIGVFSSGSSSDRLTVQGIVLAKKFELHRTGVSSDAGSEVIINDGRMTSNPPPGAVDISTNPAFKPARPYVTND